MANSVTEYKNFIHEFFSWIILNGFKAYAGTQSHYSRKKSTNFLASIFKTSSQMLNRNMCRSVTPNLRPKSGNKHGKYGYKLIYARCSWTRAS